MELKDYLKNARHYMYPDVPEDENLRRERLTKFCYDHGLDKRFLALVESDSDWCDLAAKVTVRYYAQQIRPLSKMGFPIIRLCRWDLNTIPVIEVFVEEDYDFL